MPAGRTAGGNAVSERDGATDNHRSPSFLRTVPASIPADMTAGESAGKKKDTTWYGKLGLLFVENPFVFRIFTIMKFFEKYIPGNRQLNPALFWEYDIPTTELGKYPRLVATRIIQFGRLEDFYAAFDILGGINAFAKIAKEQVIGLTPKDLNFICHAFGFKKEDTLCYKKNLLRQQLLNF